MANFRELLKKTKSEITEVSTEQAEKLLVDDWTLLDVREPDEFEQGAISGSLHIPRGNLETSIEARLPNKETKNCSDVCRRRAFCICRKDAPRNGLQKCSFNGWWF